MRGSSKMQDLLNSRTHLVSGCVGEGKGEDRVGKVHEPVYRCQVRHPVDGHLAESSDL